LDRLTVLRNLKIIEDNAHLYDPKVLEYERLKAQVLLDEGGMKAFKAYTKGTSAAPEGAPRSD
jgi:hypothetical protein